MSTQLWWLLGVYIGFSIGFGRFKARKEDRSDDAMETGVLVALFWPLMAVLFVFMHVLKVLFPPAQKESR